MSASLFRRYSTTFIVLVLTTASRCRSVFTFSIACLSPVFSELRAETMADFGNIQRADDDGRTIVEINL